jgi:AcrR family transcriptional regulator
MGKVPATRQLILDQALSLVRTIGFESVSIGVLADKVGMSKSGLFAHFKSKESLQIMVLEHASSMFVKKVVLPSIKKQRGRVRLEAIISAWIKWSMEEEGGSCPLISAAIEFDDRPGPVKDRVREQFSELHQTIKRAVDICIEERDFSKKADSDQVAQEIFGHVMAFHLYKKTIAAKDAGTRFNRAIKNLLDSLK